jgi:aspartate racemase
VQATAAELVAHGAESLIVACTELPLILMQQHVTVPLFDPTRILARSAVTTALGSALVPEGAGR